jgi:hypothetical protein
MPTREKGRLRKWDKAVYKQHNTNNKEEQDDWKRDNKNSMP